MNECLITVYNKDLFKPYTNLFLLSLVGLFVVVFKYLYVNVQAVINDK